MHADTNAFGASVSRGCDVGERPDVPSGTGSAPVYEGNIGELPVYLFVTGVLRTEVQKQLDEMNATLAQRDDVKAKLTVTSVEAFNPVMIKTQYPDRPNHNAAQVRHAVEIRISDIKYMLWGRWRDYPWGRSIMGVDVNIFCSG